MAASSIYTCSDRLVNSSFSCLHVWKWCTYSNQKGIRSDLHSQRARHDKLLFALWTLNLPSMLDCVGDLVVLIKEGVSAITDSILGSMDMPVEEAEEASEAAAVS